MLARCGPKRNCVHFRLIGDNQFYMFRYQFVGTMEEQGEALGALMRELVDRLDVNARVGLGFWNGALL